MKEIFLHEYLGIYPASISTRKTAYTCTGWEWACELFFGRVGDEGGKNEAAGTWGDSDSAEQVMKLDAR